MSADSNETQVSSTARTSTKSDKPAQRASRNLRLVVLGIGLAIITGIGIAHQRGVKVVGVDALCPFGGIETLWTLITSATLIQRVAVSSVILLGVTLAIAVVFRRAFCGYICPLGAIQEFAAKIGLKLFKGKRPQMPAAIDKPARFLKYAILVFFAVWSWQAASLVIRPYDPWVAWMHLTSAELLAEFAIGFGVLVVSIIGSVVYDRFFCKYLCPMGGLLGAISRLSIFKVRRNDSTCTDCKLCDKVCPVNVKVSTVDVVNDAECINCNECVNVCPVKDTLVVSSGPAPAKSLSPTMVLGLTVALVAVGIGLPTVTGSFAWTMPSLEKTVEQAGGTINVEDIKGSMTFAEISKVTGIPEEVFTEKYGVKPEEMSSKIKDLAPIYGFDVHTDLRDFIAEKLAEQPAQ
ncbi:MAG: 4Fe-4S binding protein [Coriobacteriia bacterium]|nr:4Fe-4S binding protein [Coriobacteriia bacterium]